MDKKEARKILGVTKETSRVNIEKKYAILLKKRRMTNERAEPGKGFENMPDKLPVSDEYSFEQVTQAYNVLMGYEIAVKEDPPGKADPLLQMIGVDKKKAKNFFYYYKFHMLGAILLLISVIFIVRGCVNRVNPDFKLAFLGEISYVDAADKLKGAIKKDMPEIVEPGIDGAFLSDNIVGEQSYAMEMKTTVLFAAGDIDVFILDKPRFMKFAKLGAFMSLDGIAVELGIDMEKNKEFIVEVEDDENGGDSTKKTDTDMPGETHLFGVDIADSTVLKESGVVGEAKVAAIHGGCGQKEKAVKFLQFLMK